MSQTKSGEMKGSIEGLENLKPGEGVQVGDTKYEYGADLHTEGTPLLDPATGKTVAIRVFEFKMNPDPKVMKNFPTDMQVLFNAHAKQIATILWGDGLRPLEEVSPRVIIDKKGYKYRIFIPCEARRDTLFADKPQSLTEALSKAPNNGTARHTK